MKPMSAPRNKPTQRTKRSPTEERTIDDNEWYILQQNRQERHQVRLEFAFRFIDFPPEFALQRLVFRVVVLGDGFQIDSTDSRVIVALRSRL